MGAFARRDRITVTPIRKGLMGSTENITEIFKALSDENRVRIVSIVAREDDICACMILDELGITQPTLSHHMKVLSSCGLITGRKEGKWMHYSIQQDALDAIQAFFEDILSSKH